VRSRAGPDIRRTIARLRLTLGILALVALSSVARTSRAEDRRPRPDYDGRAPRLPVTEGLAWGPRVLLAPAWVLWTYGVRGPLRGLVGLFDQSAEDVASVGTPGTRWTLRPSAIGDVGLRPRFGAHLVFDDPAREGAPLRLLAAGGPGGFLLGASQGARVTGTTAVIEARAELDARDDALFPGLGPRGGAPERVRIDRGEAGVFAFARPSAHLDVVAAIGVRGASLSGTSANVSDEAWAAAIERLAIRIDTRTKRPDEGKLRPPASWSPGARLEVDAEHATARFGGFLSWGVRALGHVDTGRRRVLEGFATARFLDPLGDTPSPALALPTLGGDHLRGFLEGRLRGRSTFAVGAEWRWPVWIWLDGFVRVEAGNAFDAHLAGLRPGLLRLSATTGVRNHVGSTFVFEIVGGFGTEPLDDHARVTAGRFLVRAARPL
jgi:hypothetical protein